MTLTASSPASIRLEVGDAVKLPCLDVVAIYISKALLWHTVQVRSRDRIDNLSCLGEEAATRLAADLYSFINNHLFALIGVDIARLSEVNTRLRAIIEGNRQYLAQADLGRVIASVATAPAAR